MVTQLPTKALLNFVKKKYYGESFKNLPKTIGIYEQLKMDFYKHVNNLIDRPDCLTNVDKMLA